MSFYSLHHDIADKEERYYVCAYQEKTKANDIPLWVFDKLKRICDKDSAYADNLHEEFCEAELPPVPFHLSIVHPPCQYVHDIEAYHRVDEQ